jgi:hypothetical protein
MKRYNYCSQTMPPAGQWVIVWYSVEELSAQWTGAQWVDRQGRRLVEVMCWRPA